MPFFGVSLWVDVEFAGAEGARGEVYGRACVFEYGGEDLGWEDGSCGLAFVEFLEYGDTFGGEGGYELFEAGGFLGKRVCICVWMLRRI